MRILVTDDHALFRDGIISLLRVAALEVVGEAANGEQAVVEARRLRPDVVLMDINMPVLDGIQATRLIRDELPEICVVMLTVCEDDADLLRALRAGAQGYLPKSTPSDEFLELLQGLERGEPPIPRRMVARLIHAIARQPEVPEDLPRVDALTQRECQLLRLVAHGYANKAIAARLGLSENTVKYHIKNILQKLDVHNRAEAAAYAVRSGLAVGP